MVWRWRRRWWRWVLWDLLGGFQTKLIHFVAVGSPPSSIPATHSWFFSSFWHNRPYDWYHLKFWCVSFLWIIGILATSCLTLIGFDAIPLKLVVMVVFDFIFLFIFGVFNVSFPSIWLVRKLRKMRVNKVMNHLC